MQKGYIINIIQHVPDWRYTIRYQRSMHECTVVLPDPPLTLGLDTVDIRMH